MPAPHASHRRRARWANSMILVVDDGTHLKQALKQVEQGLHVRRIWF